MENTVRVTLDLSYSGVEYRWWPHSGFGPVPLSVYSAWTGVTPGADRSFLVSDVVVLSTNSLNYKPVNAAAPTFSLAQPFDFQVRLVSVQSVDGESVSVSGEPSDAVVLKVWGGSLDWEW